ATELITGASARQGPHHSAQKSTRTGVEAFRTSVSKLASVNVTVCSDDMSASQSFRRALQVSRLPRASCRARLYTLTYSRAGVRHEESRAMARATRSAQTGRSR